MTFNKRQLVTLNFKIQYLSAKRNYVEPDAKTLVMIFISVQSNISNQKQH